MTALQEQLKSLLDYDPSTGVFLWRPRPLCMFREEMHQKRWNTRWAGKPALSVDNGQGYLVGRVLYSSQSAHRVAWAYVYGNWPPEQIDHINGDRSDNRIENLRAVPNSENQKNRCTPKNNTSGSIGVDWDAVNKKWRASIMASGRRVRLGYFKRKREAIAARKAAERKYGFHPNHGRTA